MMPHFSTVTFLTPTRRTFRLAPTGWPALRISWCQKSSRWGDFQEVMGHRT